MASKIRNQQGKPGPKPKRRPAHTPNLARWKVQEQFDAAFADWQYLRGRVNAKGLGRGRTQPSRAGHYIPTPIVAQYEKAAAHLWGMTKYLLETDVDAATEEQLAVVLDFQEKSK